MWSDGGGEAVIGEVVCCSDEEDPSDVGEVLDADKPANEDEKIRLVES